MSDPTDIVNPYKSPSNQSETTAPTAQEVELPGFQRRPFVHFFFGVVAGGIVYPVYFLLPNGLVREVWPLSLVFYFVAMGILMSWGRSHLLLSYVGILIGFVLTALPWLTNSPLFPVNSIVLVWYASCWWIGVLLNRMSNRSRKHRKAG